MAVNVCSDKISKLTFIYISVKIFQCRINLVRRSIQVISFFPLYFTSSMYIVIVQCLSNYYNQLFDICLILYSISKQDIFLCLFISQQQAQRYTCLLMINLMGLHGRSSTCLGDQVLAYVPTSLVTTTAIKASIIQVCLYICYTCTN